MTAVHLRRNGKWQMCQLAEGTCPLPCHVPDMTVEQARALPEPFIEQLFEAIDPPVSEYDQGWTYKIPTRAWREGGNLQEHREFGLPAVIREDGSRFWYQHGLLHRGGDKPAVVRPLELAARGNEKVMNRQHPNRTLVVVTGTREWWRQGQLSRQAGPAVINEATGYQAWYRKGQLHRDGRHPAVIHGDGSVEYWWRGRQRQDNGRG